MIIQRIKKEKIASLVKKIEKEEGRKSSLDPKRIEHTRRIIRKAINPAPFVFIDIERAQDGGYIASYGTVRERKIFKRHLRRSNER